MCKAFEYFIGPGHSSAPTEKDTLQGAELLMVPAAHYQAQPRGGLCFSIPWPHIPVSFVLEKYPQEKPKLVPPGQKTEALSY